MASRENAGADYDGRAMQNSLTDVSFWSDEPDWSEEETDNPAYADDRNFYKVEKWTKDGTKVDRLLYAGNNLEKARTVHPPIADMRSQRTKCRKVPKPALSKCSKIGVSIAS